MAKKKGPGLRIKTEVLIVLVFFLCFIIWAISKCSDKKQEYVISDPETEETNAIVEDTLAAESEIVEPPQAELTTTNPTAEGNPNTIIKTVYATKLYVSIDGLKLRRGPSIDSPFITTLTLFDELTFLNEVTDSTDIISVGNGITENKPWVKVRHWKGNEGWVYGAFVNYYKQKYPFDLN